MKTFNQGQWGSGDSNPDASLHQILSLARLPVPALPQGIQHDPKSCCFPHPQKVTPTKIAPALELRYQPSQLWPAGFLFASPIGWRGYNIVTDNANETFFLDSSNQSQSLVAPLTMPECVAEVVP